MNVIDVVVLRPLASVLCDVIVDAVDDDVADMKQKVKPTLKNVRNEIDVRTCIVVGISVSTLDRS